MHPTAHEAEAQFPHSEPAHRRTGAPHPVGTAAGTGTSTPALVSAQRETIMAHRLYTEDYRKLLLEQDLQDLSVHTVSHHSFFLAADTSNEST